MANPFDEPTNYGTVSGQSTGFRRRDEFDATKQRIADMVQKAQQQTNNLRQSSNRIGTSADNEILRRRINNLMHTTIEQLETAKSSLRELMEIVRETRDKGQELALKSLSVNVRKAMQEFKSVGDEVQERLQEVPQPPSTTPSLSTGGYLDSGELDVNDDRARLLRSPAKVEEPESQQQQQEFFVSNEATFAEERAERMRDLETDILDLNEIMGEIGQMVVEQGETIDTIETEVERGHTQVQQANEQLSKAVGYKRSSRKLKCCMCISCIVVLIIILIIIVVVAVVLSHK